MTGWPSPTSSSSPPASSDRQVEAIVDAVEERLRALDAKPLRREGKRDGRWVLLDYGDVVVHVQHEEERAFYALERLWRDCPLIALDLGGAPRATPARDAAVPAPRRIVVLRHGRTAWNVEGRFQGRHHPDDPPLDDVGLAQAARPARTRSPGSAPRCC